MTHYISHPSSILTYLFGQKDMVILVKGAGLYTHTHTHTYICLHIYIYIYMYIFVYGYKHSLYIYIYRRVSIYICEYLSIYVLFIAIYRHTHISSDLLNILYYNSDFMSKFTAELLVCRYTSKCPGTCCKNYFQTDRYITCSVPAFSIDSYRQTWDQVTC